MRTTCGINQRRRSETGSILILTLWALVVLSVLAVSLGYGIREQILVEKRLGERDELRQIAEAGVKTALSGLGKLDRRWPFSLKDERNEHFLPAVKGEVGRGQFRIHSGSHDAFGQTLIVDENRKINVNAADHLTLKHLFQRVAHTGERTATALAYAILDYRDSDDHVRGVFEGGSEAGAYEAARLPYGPKNADFEFVAELLRVKGMTDEIYLSVFDAVTVYGEGKININTATEDVLYLILENESLVQKVLAGRSGFDGREGTSDDFVFKQLNTVQQDLNALYGLTDVETDALGRAVMYNKITVSSDHFRIVSEATLGSAQTRGGIACIYGIGRGIRYWMEF